jgi:hypothetical protein
MNAGGIHTMKPAATNDSSTTIRISFPSEAISINALLGQAVCVNDKAYIIRAAELSPRDASMVILTGYLKSATSSNKQPREFKRSEEADNAD